MNYEVSPSQLREHAIRTSGCSQVVVDLMRSSELDAARHAMPGSLSAQASSWLRQRFDAAAASVAEDLEGYGRCVTTCANNYAEQEQRATALVTHLFESGSS